MPGISSESKELTKAGFCRGMWQPWVTWTFDQRDTSNGRTLRERW